MERYFEGLVEFAAVNRNLLQVNTRQYNKLVLKPLPKVTKGFPLPQNALKLTNHSEELNIP